MKPSSGRTWFPTGLGAEPHSVMSPQSQPVSACSVPAGGPPGRGWQLPSASVWGFTFYKVFNIFLFGLDNCLGREAWQAVVSLLHRRAY